MRIKLNPRDPEALRLVRDVVANGGVIVYPTDTVYGIGCDPFRPEAVEKVYRIKRREEKPMPVLVSRPSKVAEIAEVNPVAVFLMGEFWPGALTIVMRAKGSIPEKLIAEGKVGVRMPNHELALKVIDASGGALVGTSANVSGCPPARSLDELDPRIEGGADAVIEADGGGSKPLGMASTVILIEMDEARQTTAGRVVPKIKLLRRGGIEADLIKKKLSEEEDTEFEWI